MGFEKRGGRWHCYYKVRDGDTVRSYHVGGAAAEVFRRLDQRRDRRRKWKRRRRRPVEKTTSRLKRLLRHRRTLDAVVLYQAGFHRHKGMWRKHRSADLFEEEKEKSEKTARARSGKASGAQERLRRLAGAVRRLDCKEAARADLRLVRQASVGSLHRWLVWQLARLILQMPRRLSPGVRRQRGREVIRQQIQAVRCREASPAKQRAELAVLACAVEAGTLGELAESCPALYTSRQWKKRLKSARCRLERSRKNARRLACPDDRPWVILATRSENKLKISPRDLKKFSRSKKEPGEIENCWPGVKWVCSTKGTNLKDWSARKASGIAGHHRYSAGNLEIIAPNLPP